MVEKGVADHIRCNRLCSPCLYTETSFHQFNRNHSLIKLSVQILKPRIFGGHGNGRFCKNIDCINLTEIIRYYSELYLANVIDGVSNTNTMCMYDEWNVSKQICMVTPIYPKIVLVAFEKENSSKNDDVKTRARQIHQNRTQVVIPSCINNTSHICIVLYGYACIQE